LTLVGYAAIDLLFIVAVVVIVSCLSYLLKVSLGERREERKPRERRLGRRHSQAGRRPGRRSSWPPAD
jgi:hypothetical protein